MFRILAGRILKYNSVNPEKRLILPKVLWDFDDEGEWMILLMARFSK